MERYRHISVYLRKYALFLQAYSRSEEGFWAAAGPVLGLSADAGFELLGTCIRLMLKESNPEITPQAWFEADAMLWVSGAKTSRSFARESEMVSVDEDADGIVIAIMEQKGAGHSGTDLPKTKLSLTVENAKLGSAVREALKKCPGYDNRYNQI